MTRVGWIFLSSTLQLPPYFGSWVAGVHLQFLRDFRKKNRFEADLVWSTSPWTKFTILMAEYYADMVLDILQYISIIKYLLDDNADRNLRCSLVNRSNIALLAINPSTNLTSDVLADLQLLSADNSLIQALVPTLWGVCWHFSKNRMYSVIWAFVRHSSKGWKICVIPQGVAITWRIISAFQVTILISGFSHMVYASAAYIALKEILKIFAAIRFGMCMKEIPVGWRSFVL
ncbi:unnamed protein product [Sphagnum tenellum]